MSAQQFRREHNGVTYIGVVDKENTVVGSITNGNRKWTLRGYPKINRTLGSYKHGKEVQITIWNKAGTTYEKNRVQFEQNGTRKIHSWDTVEIFFEPEVWENLIEQYERTKNDK